MENAETQIIEALIKFHGFNHKSAKIEVKECRLFINDLIGSNPGITPKEIASLIGICV